MSETQLSYVEANRAAYDAAAAEYTLKQHTCSDAQQLLIRSMLTNLEAAEFTAPYDILELGPGAGSATKMISELGHTVTALELSRPMAEIAAQTAPQARVHVGNFLEYDFGDESFDAIYLIAFLHLFPKSDAYKVVQRISELTHASGIVVVSSTIHPRSSEGYEKKDGFSSTATRFRHRYTPEEMEQVLTEEVPFDIVEYTENDDHSAQGKRWMNFILKKTL